MRGRQEIFIGPRRRARIIEAVQLAGEWKGKRGRMEIEIGQVLNPTLAGDTIGFKARLFGDRVSGFAQTVVEAIDKLELLYQERTLGTNYGGRRRRLDDDQDHSGDPRTGRRDRRSAGHSGRAKKTPADKRARAPRASARRRKGQP